MDKAQFLKSRGGGEKGAKRGKGAGRKESDTRPGPSTSGSDLGDGRGEGRKDSDVKGPSPSSSIVPGSPSEREPYVASCSVSVNSEGKVAVQVGARYLTLRVSDIEEWKADMEKAEQEYNEVYDEMRRECDGDIVQLQKEVKQLKELRGGPGVEMSTQTPSSTEQEGTGRGTGVTVATQTPSSVDMGELERRVSKIETLLSSCEGTPPALGKTQAGKEVGKGGPAVAPEGGDSWATVVGKKRKRAGGASPPRGVKHPPGGGRPPGAPVGPSGPAVPAGPAGGAGPRGGPSGPSRGPAPSAGPGGGRSRGARGGKGGRSLRRVAAAPAVVITCRDRRYEETMKIVREKVDPNQVGVGSLRHRRTVTGALLFEVEGGNGDAAAKADALAALVKEAVVGREVTVTRPRLMAEVRVARVPDSVSAEEVSAAAAGMTRCAPEDVSPMGRIVRARDGLGVIWLRLPLGGARDIAKEGSIRLGAWVRMPVALEGLRPLRCHRCLEIGHVAASCRSVADRRDRCFRCGGSGHQARGCEGAVNCPLCSDAGLPSDHRLGSGACRPPPGGGSSGDPKAPVEQRGEQRSAPPGPSGSIDEGSTDPGGSAGPLGGPV